MLGIGAGALGVAVAARVASAVVDTPDVVAALTDEEKQWVKDGKQTMEFEPRSQHINTDLADIDWDKWLEDVENMELPKQDFRQESPPIVPSGSFNSYEWKHNYINSDLVIHSGDMDTIKLEELMLQPGNVIPLDVKDDRLDAAILGFSGFKNSWDRNE